MSDFIPYGRQTIDADDIAAVADVLRGDWLTTGPSVTAFEEAVGKIAVSVADPTQAHEGSMNIAVALSAACITRSPWRVLRPPATCTAPWALRPSWAGWRRT